MENELTHGAFNYPDRRESERDIEQPVTEHEHFEDYDPTKNLPDYHSPSTDLLENFDALFSTDEVIETKEVIANTFQTNRIAIQSIDVTVGYTNTLYEIIPQKGFRINQIRKLHADLSFHLNTVNLSIEPIFNRGSIGIIVSNKEQTILPIKSMVNSNDFINKTYELPLIIGQTLTHENIIIDLIEKYHILIAGATGQGKSILLNVLITSLLYKKHPSEVKFVLIDPGRIELNLYSILEKYFLAKIPNSDEAIVTDVWNATETFQSLITEMNDRFKLLWDANVRNAKEYNIRFRQRKLNPSKGHRFLPYIVVIIDKYYDIAMYMEEMYLTKLVRKAQAVGIHIILSVQHPSQDILSNNTKSYFPVRIAFRTASRQESMIILDEEGAERLSGNGDAIYKDELSKIRLQVPYISTNEIKNITQHISNQQGYDYTYTLPDNPPPVYPMGDLNDRDPLFDEAARLIVVHQQGSPSLIQRKFSIGYNRAGRLMDQLEAAGIVGPVQGSKPREVLIIDEYSLEKLLSSLR